MEDLLAASVTWTLQRMPCAGSLSCRAARQAAGGCACSSTGGWQLRSCMRPAAGIGGGGQAGSPPVLGGLRGHQARKRRCWTPEAASRGQGASVHVCGGLHRTQETQPEHFAGTAQRQAASLACGRDVDSLRAKVEEAFSVEAMSGTAGGLRAASGCWPIQPARPAGTEQDAECCGITLRWLLSGACCWRGGNAGRSKARAREVT